VPNQPLSWQRLDRVYYVDDSIAMARAEHGYLAEILFVRWLAFGKPIAAPEDQEGAILAACLAFDPSEAPRLADCLRWFVHNGTISAQRKPGRVAKGKARVTVFDLQNRAKYRPPNRALTRSERTPISESPQVEGSPGRGETVATPRGENVATDVATYVRTDEQKPLAAKSRRAAIFDALVEAEELDLAGITRSKRGALNKAAQELDEVGATPEEIATRAATYRQVHPDWEFTANALAKHWADLKVVDPHEEQEKRRARREEREKLVAEALRERYPQLDESAASGLAGYQVGHDFTDDWPVEKFLERAPRFAKIVYPELGLHDVEQEEAAS
jgi:hypothetical protein